MEEINKLPIENLKFDFENPRLALKSVNTSDETALIKELLVEGDIEELINSITENGYLNIEPLIAVKIKGTNDVKVIEGNRRLCALKLILNPDLAKQFSISIPSTNHNIPKQAKSINVHIVEDGDNEAHSYIGFKHINGPHKWNSYAKAKYVTNWYIKNGTPIEKISAILGDNNQTVKSLVSGMLVLNQARDLGIFKIEDRSKGGPFGFSHLYTALNRVEYQEFLGLERKWNDAPSQSPISKEKLGNLGIVLNYIYGSKSAAIESVIASQNPDLKHLGEVLVNPKAISELISTNSLSKAYDELRLPSVVFTDAIFSAKDRMRDALSKLNKYEPSTFANISDAVKEIKNAADIIYRIVNSPQEAEQETATEKS